MSQDMFRIVLRLSWVITCALCWLWAYRGYDSSPRFSMWFWGIAFCFDLMLLGAAVAAWGEK